MDILKSNADEILGAREIHYVHSYCVNSSNKINIKRLFFSGLSDYFPHGFIMSIIFIILKPKCKAAIWKTEIALNPSQIFVLAFFTLTNTMQARRKKGSI